MLLEAGVSAHLDHAQLSLAVRSPHSPRPRPRPRALPDGMARQCGTAILPLARAASPLSAAKTIPSREYCRSTLCAQDSSRWPGDSALRCAACDQRPPNGWPNSCAANRTIDGLLRATCARSGSCWRRRGSSTRASSTCCAHSSSSRSGRLVFALHRSLQLVLLGPLAPPMVVTLSSAR